MARLRDRPLVLSRYQEASVGVLPQAALRGLAWMIPAGYTRYETLLAALSAGLVPVAAS